MNSLFLGLFIIAGILHLACCLKDWELLRQLTKPILIPLLIGYYLTNAITPQPIIAGALLFGFAGDVLLLSSKRSWFIAGLLAFLGGHFLYITTLVVDLNRLDYHILLPAFFLYGLIGVLAFVYLRESLGALKIPVITYLIVLEAMSLIALHRLWFNPNQATALVFIGTLLFCLSDFLLSQRFFVKAGRHPHFNVMLTYLTAQCLIVYGLR